MKRYKYEIALIIIVIVLSCIVIDFYASTESNNTSDGNLNNYFWMPSSIMQSVAAIYALFIAVFVLIIQNSQKSASIIGDLLKPPFRITTTIVAFTIYYNGFSLFIFNSFDSINEVEYWCFGSLILLFSSLIAIVYVSYWMISTVGGLNTFEERMSDLNQGKNIDKYFSEIDLDASKWPFKTEKQRSNEMQQIIKLLEFVNPDKKIKLFSFISEIKDTRAENQLI
jgi:hypothetical protein